MNRAALCVAFYTCGVLVVVLPTKDPVELLMSSRNFLTDPYGRQTSLIYEGGKILFDCYMLGNGTCRGRHQFELLDSQTEIVLATAQCKNLKLGTFGLFKIEVDQKTPFGEYQCYFRDKLLSNKSTTIAYRLCADKSQACLESVDCDNDPDMKFCFISKDGVYPCSKIPYLQWCSNVDSPKLCPIAQTGLCKAIYYDYTKAWFEWSGSKYCPNVETLPLNYKGIGRFYEEPFVIDLDQKYVEFYCRNGTPFFNEKLDLRITGAALDQNYKISQNCQNKVKLALNDDLFTNGAQIYFLELSDHYGYFRFKNKIIVFGFNLTASSIGNSTNQLTCFASGPIAEEFQLTQWWSNQGIEINQSWNLTVDKSGEYRCHVFIVYKTCSPHRKFTYNISSEVVIFSSCIKHYASIICTIAAIIIGHLAKRKCNF